MKKSEVKDVVQEFIKVNPGVNLEAIKNGTDASDIDARAAIKALLKENVIVGDETTGVYSLQSKNQEIIDAAEGKPNGKKKEDEDLGPKTFTGRDNSKYRFGELRNLPKGRLVLALVRTYVEKNPKLTLAKLQELFHSEEISPRFGIICELSAAKKFSKNNVDRHFLKPEDIIKIGNQKAAVTNQWTAEGIQKLLKIVSAKPFGFKVKVEEAAE